MLAKSVNDAGWGSFIAKLTYKAAEAGRELVKVPANGTSQRCVCGAPNPKTLGQRWHHCESCGLSVPRDHASALEILTARTEPVRRNVAHLGRACLTKPSCFSWRSSHSSSFLRALENIILIARAFAVRRSLMLFFKSRFGHRGAETERQGDRATGRRGDGAKISARRLSPRRPVAPSPRRPVYVSPCLCC